MKQIKIGLFGKARSGKDTVAEILKKKYGMTQFAFGDKLKEHFHRDYPHIPREPKPVRGYQLYGQLKRYTEGENVWIDICKKTIEETEYIVKQYESMFSDVYEVPLINPLITDIRQKNEEAFCRDNGYILIEVKAPEEERIARMKEERDDFSTDILTFETETELGGFKADIVLENNDTLKELEEKIDNAMELLTQETK